jgi:DHA1 family multidrug resistance protein-like MFS transporter
VLILCALAAAGLYALQAMVTHTWQLILLQALVGFVLAGTISSLTAMLATLAPEGQQGAVFGVSTSVVSASNAVGPMLGASLAVALSIRASFVLSAVVFVLAAALIALLLPDRQTDAALDPVPVHQSR